MRYLGASLTECLVALFLCATGGISFLAANTQSLHLHRQSLYQSLALMHLTSITEAIRCCVTNGLSEGCSALEYWHERVLQDLPKGRLLMSSDPLGVEVTVTWNRVPYLNYRHEVTSIKSRVPWTLNHEDPKNIGRESH